MSLALILPPDGAAALLRGWPIKPCVYRRDTDTLDRMISPETLLEYIDTGSLPIEELSVVQVGPVMNRGAYARPDGRTDGARLRHLLNHGYTVRLGHADRYMPGLARATQDIQAETGYSNYVTAFVTPAGHQGLDYHWDQNMAVVTQTGGRKRWELWQPVFDEPMRSIGDSRMEVRPEMIERWKSAGPDMVFDLDPGDTLVVPRGWVHNPYALDGDTVSVHATFAIIERTRFWIAEHLVALAITDPDFRLIVPPDVIAGDGFPTQLVRVRDLLVDYVSKLDQDELAAALRAAAAREIEFTS